MSGTCLIVGAGHGLSAALTRRFSAAGYSVHLAARNFDKLADLAAETGAERHLCDAADPIAVAALAADVPGPLVVAIYNAARRVRGALVDLDPAEVEEAIRVTALGAFAMGQTTARRMLDENAGKDVKGTILFTGASAGVKGFPRSAPFAMGKFAQRGLAQSMARELHPQGIHVAWVNIDGAIRNPGRAPGAPDAMLDPEAIAEAYLWLVRQHRSAWSDELTLRPWVEPF